MIKKIKNLLNLWSLEKQELLDTYNTNPLDTYIFNTILDNQHKTCHYIPHTNVDNLDAINLCKLSALILQKFSMKNAIGIQPTSNDTTGQCYITVKTNGKTSYNTVSTPLLIEQHGTKYDINYHNLITELSGTQAGLKETYSNIASKIATEINQTLYNKILHVSTPHVYASIRNPSDLISIIDNVVSLTPYHWIIISPSMYDIIISSLVNDNKNIIPLVLCDDNIIFVGKLGLLKDIKVYVNPLSLDNDVILGYQHPYDTSDTGLVMIPYVINNIHDVNESEYAFHIKYGIILNPNAQEYYHRIQFDIE